MEPDQTQALLSQLRGVQQSWWWDWFPPAIGWWIVIGLLVCIGVLVYRWWQRRRAARAWQHATLEQLEQLLAGVQADKGLADEAIAACSILMRRVALAHHPRANVAGLTDEAWLTCLDQLSQSELYTQGVGRLLAQHPFMPPQQLTSSMAIELLEAVKASVMNMPREVHHV